MDEYFGATSVTNSTVLCVGGITSREAEAAADEGLDVSGDGYYLFLAEMGDVRRPIHLLAKFFSPMEADTFSRILRRQPAMGTMTA
jgi:hypothetical protein